MPPGHHESRSKPSPGCYNVGTSGFWLDYKVKNALFPSPLTVIVTDGAGQLYWSNIYYVPPEGLVELTGLAMPGYIDKLTFTVQWAHWQPAVIFPVYVVLEKPKAPMDPAWVSVLDISCVWARGESTADGAANKLIDELYNQGTYNGGYHAYTSNETDNGEIFHLRSFLADSRFPWGQCNDFADFLVCLITSVGAYAMKAQRTNPLAGPGFYFNPLVPAGGNPPPSNYWNYHQFALFNSSVWDGCISIISFGIPKGWARDTEYRPRLVDHYDPPGYWNPTPLGGFMPTVTAN